jgi:alkanesulfonate monooxygenase SsuD/methylene tetrahydromethanopterin reductase-like flavin-dependent oxidoreductase (luciferase family)
VKQTFTFTAPDGTTLKRTSETRTYTHAIIYKNGAGKWVIGSCVGRPELVAERLEQWGRGSPDCIAVEADADKP